MGGDPGDFRHEYDTVRHLDRVHDHLDFFFLGHIHGHQHGFSRGDVGICIERDIAPGQHAHGANCFDQALARYGDAAAVQAGTANHGLHLGTRPGHVDTGTYVHVAFGLNDAAHRHR